MDPNACLKRYIAACDLLDVDEAEAAHADLVAWLNGGGFEPDWKVHRVIRSRFMSGASLECVREYLRDYAEFPA